MSTLGVNYFSPIKVEVSDFHPSVLFIQCLEKVLIIEITKRGVDILAEIQSPATKEPVLPKWQMAIARGQLIIVNPPNTIEEHDLS